MDGWRKRGGRVDTGGEKLLGGEKTDREIGDSYWE